MTKQSVFLLSYLKYGDYDAILHCYSQENAFQSFFVKGIYTSKNKKKAYLLPLNELQLTLNASKNGAIPNINKIEQFQNFGFYENVKSSSIIFFLADFLHQILRNESNSKQIYQEIKLVLHEIENQNLQAHFIFLFRILRILGLSPLSGNGEFLNPETGNFSITKNHQLFDEEISEIWRKLIKKEEQSYEIILHKTLKKQFLESVLIYYQYHFPDFRIPNSLEILKSIFEN